VIAPFRFADATRHDFGLSAQADRLLLSACFRESGGAIECITCHDPHVPVYDPERPEDWFNRRCRGCHDRDACTGPAEARRATSPADDCTGCHMRRAEPDDQRYTLMTDHWIRRRIDDDTRDPREHLGIEPVRPGRFEARVEAEQAYYRGRAAYLLSLKTGDPRREALWKEAGVAFEQAIAGGLDRADAWFFLGRTREYLGESEAAIEAFERAVDRDPRHHDAALALATALLATGRIEPARDALAGILEQDPDHAGALAELGRSHLGDDLERALELYRRAADAEPWNGSLLGNQAMILAALGRFDEASARARDSLELDPEDVGVWETWSRILIELGREDQARETARVAAAIARARS
jgi:tetratricopeptide (TPR) repeat protein